MSKLITASLIGAVDWAKTCPPSWRAKAQEDLSNQVNRIWIEPPADSPLRLGQDFERKVYEYAEKKLVVPAGSEHFQWMVKQCRGGIFQKVARKIIELDGEEYCLYGKIDVWFPDVLKDVKTTSNYKGVSHYTSSIQHVIYMYVERIPKFVYLVAEFEKGQKQIVDHHEIVIGNVDIDGLRLDIDNRIRETMEFIRQNGLMDAYMEKFSGRK
jgi:hypothetical protein